MKIPTVVLGSGFVGTPANKLMTINQKPAVTEKKHCSKCSRKTSRKK